jgi:hypothetical protein
VTTSPAAEWLEVDFDKTMKRFRRDFGGTAPNSSTWHGPSYLRPMIQLRSLLDGGTAMRVSAADYADPERWWL